MRRNTIALLLGSSLALAACGSAADESDDPLAQASPAEALPADLEASPDADASPTPSPTASESPTPTPSPSTTAKAGGMAAAAPATPPPAFNQCKACHSVEPGDHGIGPSLAGIFGTKAGAVAGFDFSDAMKGSNLTWNAANLDRFLENPQGTIPGTKMSFAGLKDEAKRKAVIDYIKSL